MTETTDATPKTLFSSTSGYALAVPMVIGLIAFVAGIIVTPHRAWLNLLVNNFYFLGLAVTAGVFIAMHGIVKPHDEIRRDTDTGKFY